MPAGRLAELLESGGPAGPAAPSHSPPPAAVAAPTFADAGKPGATGDQPAGALPDCRCRHPAVRGARTRGSPRIPCSFELLASCARTGAQHRRPARALALPGPNTPPCQARGRRVPGADEAAAAAEICSPRTLVAGTCPGGGWRCWKKRPATEPLTAEEKPSCRACCARRRKLTAPHSRNDGSDRGGWFMVIFRSFPCTPCWAPS